MMLFVCHGAGGSALSTEALVKALGEGAFGLSYPGRSDSPGPPLASVSQLADYVRVRVLELGGGPAAEHVVVGHSMGGAVALEYALQRPPGLRALVLISTGARLRVHPSILAVAEGLAAAEVAEGLDGAEVAEGLDGAEVAEGLDGAEARGEALCPPEGFPLTPGVPALTSLADWRAADAFDRMEDIASIETPTLILVGSEDALTPPKYAGYLQRTIHGSELHTFPGAGHDLPRDEPERVAAYIMSFVKRHPLTP